MANTEQQREAVIRKLYETQCNAVGVIMEAEKMKEALNNNGDDTKGLEMAMIPFAAYEMQQDRHASEMDKTRKHYLKIIACISAVLIALLLGVAGTLIYFLSSYEVASYEQEGVGINNIVGNDSEQGDVVNGATTEDSKTKAK